MKTYNFLILLVVTLFVFNSCSSDNNAKNMSSTVAETESESETRGINATKGFRRFSVDNTFLELKDDYKLGKVFEASFEEGIMIKGKWEKEGDKLKLSSEKSGDGKGKVFLKEFTIIEHNDEVLKLVDSEGKKIEMSAEE